EQGQYQVLPARPHVEIELSETERQEARQVCFIRKERGTRETPVDMATHETGRAVRLGALHMVAHEFAGPCAVQVHFRAGPPEHAGFSRCIRSAQVVDQPLSALLSLGASQPKPPPPAAQLRRTT